ncbi:hypothetical protein JCM33374_g5489 [Metschnikowia sp. JCM 33374]|nr:hypothetical protein JCM33374_g5489 [Metschnikowia sp. JCM 33374]
MTADFQLVKSETLPKFSDKCNFPPSLLQEVITAHESLPHPLVFLLNDHILVGVREFTADEDTIVAPEEVCARLNSQTVSCTLQPLLPKATSLRIRPAQFYPHITNWKYYLESFLSSQYTTLSEKQHFSYHDPVVGVDVSLMVDTANSQSVVVVDTDIALDVAPLNDIMAAQQLQQESAMMKCESVPEISSNATVDLEPFNKSAHPLMYKVNLLRFPEGVTISLTSADDAYNTDIISSLDKFLNLESFLWTTMAQDSDGRSIKHLIIDTKSDVITNTRLKHQATGELWLYIVPFAWEHNSSVKLEISGINTVSATSLTSNMANSSTPDTTVLAENDGKSQCENCKVYIEKSKLPLHEAFCFRNNVRCSCGEIFPKAIPNTHWHCEICSDVHGDSALFKFKHDKLFHNQPYMCDKCPDTTNYHNFIDLVQIHKAGSCPSRLHECQFCHLVVPQGESTFEDRFLNLTRHENECGNKTVDCYQCGKLLRNKELSSHMKMHEIVKTEKNAEVFPKCANINCINKAHDNPLSLCEMCYGPLYLSVLDPNNMKLQSRIERRYVLQLTKGCGHAWCCNRECANGNTKLDFKQALAHVKTELFSKIASPSLPTHAGKPLATKNEVWFCVSESMQSKKKFVESLLNEGQYGVNMIYKAVEARGELGAREWLVQNAI